jgi:hypothetical protein
MTKDERKRWLIWAGAIIGIILVGFEIISFIQDGKLNLVIGASILGSGILFAGVIVNVAFTTASSNKQEEMEEKQNNIEKEVYHVKSEIKTLSGNQKLMKVAINDIDESFKHKREIVNLCQQIENETSDIFEGYSEINAMLRDYIVGVNFVITDIIERQYSYDFNLFDAKYFKSKLINRVNSLTKEINFAMLDKRCFEKISDKVLTNIRTYITDLKYIKDLENGTRRKRFKELTLNLTKKITDHSIDIYKNHKQAV